MQKKKKNNKKNIVLIFIVMCVVAGLGYMWMKNRSELKVEYYVTDRERREIAVGSHRFEVEVVTSPQSLSQGLSGRDSIGADGMLFLFNKKRVVSFWMKEMRFDLDMLWIADNKIQGIIESVPKPAAGTALEDLETYSSVVPVNAVLELPAGTTKKTGIKVGDTVTLPILAP